MDKTNRILLGELDQADDRIIHRLQLIAWPRTDDNSSLCGAYVPIPVADTLKDALDAAPRRCPIILTNSDGKPWSESGFQGAWGKATTRAGIRGLTFHDLRGTAVVTLARAGCNEVEIYSITGHKPGDVQAILTTHYLPRDAEVALNAIAKLNRYKTARGDQGEDENLPTTSRPH